MVAVAPHHRDATCTDAMPGRGSGARQVKYRAEMDIDRDGDVDSTDQTLRGTTWVAALPKGALSTPGPGSSGGVDSTVGWSGYRYDQPTRLYAVRFRFYDAVTFRWLNRDPAGYVDSMNLYGYGVSNPLRGADPFGLGFYVKGNNGHRRYISRESARTRLEDKQDVYADTAHEAKSLAREVWGDDAAPGVAEKPGHHDHWQHKNSGRGHIKYGKPRPVGYPQRAKAIGRKGAGVAAAFLMLLGAYDAGADIAPELEIAFYRLANATTRGQAEWEAQGIADLLTSLGVSLSGAANFISAQEKVIEAWSEYRRMKQMDGDAVESSPSQGGQQVEFHSVEYHHQIILPMPGSSTLSGWARLRCR